MCWRTKSASDPRAIDERIRAVGEVDLLESLREADVRDVEAEVLEDLRRDAQLAAAAVHHDERRWVGEPPPRPPGALVLLLQQP